MAFVITPVITFDIGVVASNNRSINTSNSNIVHNTCNAVYEYINPLIDIFQDDISEMEYEGIYLNRDKQYTLNIDDLIEMFDEVVDPYNMEEILNAKSDTPLGSNLGYIFFNNYYACRISNNKIIIDDIHDNGDNKEFILRHKNIVDKIYNQYLNSDRYNEAVMEREDSTLVIIFINIFITVKNWPMMDCMIEVDKSGNVKFI